MATLVFVLTPLQAVRLESGWSERVRYMVVIYTSGHQDTEENIVLGMDFTDKDRWSHRFDVTVGDFIGLLLDWILFTYFCHTFVIDSVDDCTCLDFMRLILDLFVFLPAALVLLVIDGFIGICTYESLYFISVIQSTL